MAGGCPDTAAAQPAPTADAEPQPQWENDGCPGFWSSDPYGNCKAPDAGADGLGESTDTTDGTTPDGSNAGANNNQRFTSSVTAPRDERLRPYFNIYNNVKLHYGIGSERDFLRLGTRGELGNTLEVCENETVDLWFYVHNGLSSSQNAWTYTGPGVAEGTTVKIDVDENLSARLHKITGSIDSDQTEPITDGITISCSSRDIKLKYKGVSYFGTPAPVAPLGAFENYELQGDISKGALLGYTAVHGNGITGIVPGCWDYRARINIQLEVEVL